jgi:hypothetical protein
VHDAEAVGVGEAVSHLLHDPNGLPDGQLTLMDQPIT